MHLPRSIEIQPAVEQAVRAAGVGPADLHRLEHAEETQSDGSVILRGTLFQENAPDDFLMPLPLVLRYGKDKFARTTILAFGARQTISMKIPGLPSDVELDPDLWILSEKTSEKNVQ